MQIMIDEDNSDDANINENEDDVDDNKNEDDEETVKTMRELSSLRRKTVYKIGNEIGDNLMKNGPNKAAVRWILNHASMCLGGQFKKSFKISIGDCVAITCNILTYLKRIKHIKSAQATMHKKINVASMMCGINNGFDISQRLLHDTFGLSFQVTQEALDIRTKWEYAYCTAKAKMEEEKENVDAEAITQIRVCFDTSIEPITRKRVSSDVQDTILQSWIPQYLSQAVRNRSGTKIMVTPHEDGRYYQMLKRIHYYLVIIIIIVYLI